MTEVEGFFPGDVERSSAKKRRQEAYKKDLQLQMLEQNAARKRERIQDMNVNASGWLDPEKGPERLKPLGGAGFMTDRTNRDSKVRPYHSLFNYDQLPKNAVTMYEDRGPATVTAPNIINTPMARPARVNLDPQTIQLDPPAGLTIQPLTLATTGQQPYPPSNHDAYNFYATRELDRPAAYGSIIQPLSIPYVDNRPIIMPGRYDYPMESGPRYNPFHNYDGIFKEIKSLIGNSQIENERLKNQRIKDYDEYQRRMRQELEDERRRLMEQERDARRRIEELRREAEERRREWERKMREERAREPAKTDVVVLRPSSSTLLVDMEDTRRRLADERRKIEEMLRMQLRAPDYTQVKVLKRPPPPPTPRDPDRADPRNILEFQHLKHIDHETRHAFRRMYPEEPETNKRLENQQEALLRQQQDSLNTMSAKKVPPGWIFLEKGLRRPSWMDKTPTPFPHRLRQRDRLYTTQSLHGDLERVYRKTEKRARAIEIDADAVIDDFDRFRLRNNRPSSTETLADDTWLRSSSVQNF